MPKTNNDVSVVITFDVLFHSKLTQMDCPATFDVLIKKFWVVGHFDVSTF